MELTEIGDRLEIQDIYARYVHAVDKADYDTLDARVFTSDAMFDYSQANGPVFTWTELREADMFGGNGFEHIFHLSSNLVIDFDETGTRASCYSKTFNPWAKTDDDGKALTFQIHGTYYDVVEKTERGWRIAGRRWVEDWVSGWEGGTFRLLATMTEVGSI
ncbi:hypothetical protein GCM10022381_28290 [Leifsonia kafniensis]|uniref:SnoaL-like domain-containing protein n=1 Tax=Leifsonia kafniensis TaxID=475957 RepID=A0ABP7KP82_9MICO